MNATFPRYAPAARALHWVMAAIIVVIVPLGMYCASLRGVPGREAERDALLLWHKSLGLVILLLAVARILYRWRNPPPPLPASMARAERAMAHGVHVALYALLLLAPLSGVLLSQAAGQPVSLFGIVQLPQVVPIDLAVPAAERPAVLAGVILHKLVFKFALIGLLLWHLAGVLKHALVDKDASFFRRMWWPSRQP